MASYHHGSLPAALLAAAETILQRDGIGALTLRAAAREAGVSHTAPAHHFGDLSGLLSALAAAGFTRLGDFARAEAGDGAAGEKELLLAHSRGYIAFARAHPGLFRLMFRSERLDWSVPALAHAGADAYALLAPPVDPPEARAAPGPDGLADTLARWSYIHGLAILLIDGRLSASVGMVPGADEDVIIAELIDRLVRLDKPVEAEAEAQGAAIVPALP